MSSYEIATKGSIYHWLFCNSKREDSSKCKIESWSPDLLAECVILVFLCIRTMANTLVPIFLKPGDTIGITATARWLEPGQLHMALEVIAGWGFKVKLSDALFERNGQLAGSDERRADELQFMLDDPEVRAVLVARGGYGTVRILDRIDWTRFLVDPKWICGYSDITVLLSWLTNHGFSGIHSTMPISFPDATPEALGCLKSTLSGDFKRLSWESTVWSTSEVNCQGKIVGGNLSVICSNLGSASQLNTEGCILFLEDVDEHLYHIDRMFWALRRARLLDSVKAIVLGGMTQIKDNTIEFGFKTDNPWGVQVHEIVRGSLKDTGIPILGGLPAGHQNDNRAFYLGREVQLTASLGLAAINYL